MKNNGDFNALLFQMKNIARWGLMYNTRQENLSEHSMECAVLAHALALIGNREFGKNYDAARILSAALFHDMNEVLTGDLPTPIKYYNDNIKESYKEIERISLDKMPCWTKTPLGNTKPFLIFPRRRRELSRERISFAPILSACRNWSGETENFPLPA